MKENSKVTFGSRRAKGRGSIQPVEKPKNFKGTILRLWKYFGSEKRVLITIFLSIIVDSVITLSVPYIIGKSIDAMSSFKGKVDFQLLLILVAILLFAYGIDSVLNLFQGWFMAASSQNIVMNLRKSLFYKLQKLPISFFDKNANGEIMSRLTNDIDNVSTTISQSLIQMMSAIAVVAGSFIMMMILSPILTFVSLSTVPLVFILTKSIAKKTSVLFKDQQTKLGLLNGHIEESISGMEVVKAFNNEKLAIDKFSEINDDLCRTSVKAQIYSGFLMPIMNVINNLGFAIVAGAGGILTVKDIITVGTIASFLSYSRQFVRPLNNIASIFNSLQSAVAGAERVFDILDEKEEEKDRDGAEDIQHIMGDVTFENVSFWYKKGIKVLQNISFDVKRGSNVAIVGPTGAGKTTIINLLTGFYNVSTGRILIDGIDIKDFTRNSLRKCFGIVLQDTYLFRGTILENIRYGKLNADFHEIKKAAEAVKADKFIDKLPYNYNTVLQENGSNLSQGERQLITVARAILSDPAILIMDEATSNVDTITEMRMQEAMSKLMVGRTCFIIAHRLSTIMNSDIILVVDNGKIVEKGNHLELIKKRGQYYNMCRTQFDVHS